MASPAILYRGGELDSLRLVSGTAVASTPGGSYDSTYSACAIAIRDGVHQGIFAVNGITPTSVDGGDDLWGMAVFGAGPNPAGPFMTIFDSSNRAAYRINVSGSSTSTLTFQHNTSSNATPSWTSLGSYVTSNGSYVVYRIKTGSEKDVSFFVNGVEVFSSAITNAYIGPLSYFNSGQTTNQVYISQIQFSRNIPLVNSRVLTRKASGAGSFSEMAGAYTDLVKTSLNDVTSIVSTVVGQVSTFAYQDATVPEGMVMADDVWIWSRGKNDGSEPSSMKIVSIADSVTTKSPNLPFDIGFKQMPAVFSGMTLLKWNGSEIGMESTTP